MHVDTDAGASHVAQATVPRLQRCKLVVVSLLVLLCAAVFGTLFTLLSLHNLYLESLASEYRLAARELQADLRIQPRPPTRTELDNVAETLGQISRKNLRFLEVTVRRTMESPVVPVLVLDALGNTLYKSGEPVRTARRWVPEKVANQIAHLALMQPDLVPPWEYITTRSGMYIILPASRPDAAQQQFVVLHIRPAASTDLAMAFSKKFARNIAFILIVGMLVLLLALYHLMQESVTPNPRRHRLIMVCLFTTLVAIQGVTTGIGLLSFNQSYSDISQTKAQVILNLIKSEIEPYLAIGIRIELFADMESYLREWVGTHAELSGFEVRNKDNDLVFTVDDEAAEDWSAISFGDLLARQFRPGGLRKTTVMNVVLRSPNGLAATITARFSQTAMYRNLYDTFINGLTIIIIASLIALEVLTLVTHYMGNASNTTHSKSSRFLVMRPAMFFFLFGIDISMSFVPLQMEQVFEPMWGLSKDVIIGLPVSAEFLAVGIAILISGVWSDRRGWQEPFLGGVLLSASGMYYSYIADTAMMFIVARAIVGLGFGLVLLAAQSYVVLNTSEKNKTLGLAHLFAGLYAGSISGSAVGAMLADWFDYATVFIIGCGFLIGVFFFGVVFMGRNTKSSTLEASEPARPALTRRNLIAFMGDRKVLSVTLLCSLPAAIAVVGFLNYFSPVYLDRLGASQTTIGQVLMIYGLSLVLLGPPVGRLIDRLPDKRYAMFIGTVLGGFAFLSFAFLEGLSAVFTGMILIGLSSSFVLASQSAYLLTLDATRAIGNGLAMALFRSSSRIGQVLGPAVFAGFVGAVTSVTGIVYFGVAYLVLGILFMHFSRSPSEQPERSSRFLKPPVLNRSTSQG